MPKDKAYDPNAELDGLLTSFTPSAAPPPAPEPAQSPAAAAPDYDPNAVLDSLLVGPTTPPAGENQPYDPKGVVDPYEGMGGYMFTPELRDILKHPLAIPGLINADRESVKGIFAKNFPDTQVEQQPDGSLVIHSAVDKKPYVFRQGVPQLDDLVRAAIGVPVYAAGGLVGAGVLGGAAASAPSFGAAVLGTGLANRALGELRHSAGGAAPSLLEDAGAMFLHGLISGTGKAGKALFNRIAGPEVEAAGELLAPKQLGEVISRAAHDDAGAQATLARQVRPNPEVVAAANRLPGPDGSVGILDSLTPAQVSDNPALRTVSRAVAGDAETHQEALRRAANAFTRGIQENEGPVAADQAEKIKQGITDVVKASGEGVKSAYNAVGVPPEHPMPVGNILSKIDEILGRNKGAAAPELVQNIRAKLVPADGSLPSWDTVDMLVKDLGAGVKGKGAYKNLNASGIANALREAGKLDQQAAANAFSEGAGERFTAAQNAFKAHNYLKADYKSVLSNNFEASLAGKLVTGVRNIGYGIPEGLKKIMRLTPPEYREFAAKAGLYQFVENQQMDAPKFVGWMEALKRNNSEYQTLKTYIGPKMMQRLEDVYQVTKSIKAASEAAKPHFATMFPDQPLPVSSMAKTLLKAGVGNFVFRPLRAAGFELPQDYLNWMVLDRVFSTGTKTSDAVQNLLMSPAGRAGMTADLSGKVTQGFIRNFMSAGPVKRVLDTLQIPMAERYEWVRNAFQNSAAGLARQGIGQAINPGEAWNKEIE